MDLRSHLLSVLLLLTASEAPPVKADIHPKFLQGVWECSAGGEFIRLALDADGNYVQWRVPDQGSSYAGYGYAGTWELADDTLVLMRNHKHLTPGDGEDREHAIQRLQAQGHHALAEELARTLSGWVGVSDEEATIEAFKLRSWNKRALHIRQWLISKSEDDLESVDLDLVCHRQTLHVKPALSPET